MTLSLIAALFFLVLNVFFVLAEFALIKAQVPRLEVMRQEGRLRAGIVLKMIANLDNYLSAIQVGVTISTLALGWAGEPVISHAINERIHWPDWLSPYGPRVTTALSFCLIIYAQIVFAELVPRVIALQRAEPIILWACVPLKIFYEALRGPIVIMARSATFISRLLGFKPVREHNDAFTEDEMRVLLGMSQEKGLLTLDRLLLIENVFDLEDLKVRDAMVPTEKIVFLSTGRSWDENRQALQKNHFSRYPLAHPDLENVVGYIHLKDLAFHGTGAPDLPKLARPLTSVEDTAPLRPLLKAMASQGKHMMLVKHEGKVTGLITLEDVVEELIGEILDEFDAPNAWSLSNLLSDDLVDMNLKATTSQEAIHALLTRMATVQPEIDPKSALTAIMNRESQLPTAIGHEVAVPHARLNGLIKPLVAVGRCERGVGFNAPDKAPVKLVFLILTSVSSPMDQLRILSRVATLAQNATLLKQLMRAKTPAQFLYTVRSSESIVAG